MKTLAFQALIFFSPIIPAASITITATETNNTATVYYEVDEAQNAFPYEVNYYLSGSTTAVPGIDQTPTTGNATPSGTGYIGESVAIAHPTLTTGYKVAASQPTELSVKADGSASATVYYEVDTAQSFAYTVNYYISGTTTQVPGIDQTAGTGNATPSGTGYVGEVIAIAQPTLDNGYRVEGGQPTSLIVNGDGTATATVFYSVNAAETFGYTINYYLDGTTTPVPGISPNPTTGTGVLNQVITVPQPTLQTGYKVMDSQPTSITITATETNNTATVYYEVDTAQNSFAYTVNYYISGTTTAVPGIDQTPTTGNATPSGTGYIGESVTIAHPTLTTGYKVAASQPTTLTVKADGSASATVYYEVDDTQNSFAYTVNYYISGTTNAVPGIDQTATGNATPSGTGYVGQSIVIEQPALTTGYKVSAAQPTELQVKADGTATATVYYEIDEDQKFDYRVTYYITGTTTPVPGIAPNPIQSTGYVTETIAIAHPTLTTGYKVSDNQPTSLQVNAAGTAAATVYYEIDEAQNTFPYTVNYYIAGTTAPVPGIDQTAGTGNATPSGTGYIGQSISVLQPTLTSGYKVSAAQPMTLEIKADGTAAATVYYEVDETQNNFAYTVNYYISGTTTAVPGIDQTATGNATPSGTGYVGEVITIAQPTLNNGYRVEGGQPTSLTVNGDGTAEATVYYSIDAAETFGYTINYYLSGTTTPVPGISPNPATGTGVLDQVITVPQPTLQTGYKVVASQPTSITITATETNNTATVYYEVDEAQNAFPYEVNYYLSGSTNPVPGIDQTPTTGNATPSGTGYIGESVAIAHPTLTTGYKVAASQPTELSVKADGSASATVYYEVDTAQSSFAYKVNYFISGTITPVPGITPNPVTGTGYIGESVTIAHPPLTTGYKVSAGQPTTITVKADGTAVENVYYEVDTAQSFAYTVNYYISGTTNAVPGIDQTATGNATPSGTGYVGEVIAIAQPTLDNGYRVEGGQPTSLIVNGDGTATATVYYSVNAAETFGYTINYYLDGTTTPVPGISPNPATGTGVLNQNVTVPHPTLTTGYKVVASQPTSITITATAANNIATVYYEVDEAQNTFPYKVNYYISGTTTQVPGIAPNPVTGTGYIGESVAIAAPAVTTGYKVMTGQPTTLTVKADGTAVENVYYEVDTAQSFAYTVNYYISGTTTAVPGIDQTPTTGNATPSGTGYVGESISILHPTLTTGYKVSDSQPTTITVKADGTAVATVYYSVDATSTYGYEINYYLNGTTTQVPGISPNPTTGTGVLNQNVTVPHPTLQTGYKIMDSQPTSITITATAANNTATVYYEVDEAQNNFPYKVNYYISGTTTPVPGITPNPVTGTGYIGEAAAIAHPTLTTGYKVMTGQPTTITVKADGTAVENVYYEVDTAQNTFPYMVNYYISGTTTPVPGISPNPVTGTGYIGEAAAIAHPTLTTGYKVMTGQPTTITVKADGTASSNVYYEVDQTQNGFAYTVNYYISGTTNAVPGIDQTPTTGNATPSGTGYIGESVSILQPTLDNGYKLEGGQPTSLVVKADGTATATVYYSVNAASTYGYEINYYLNGTTTPVPGISPNPTTGTGVLNQNITVPHPTLTNGYKVVASQPTEITITATAANNTATVYYEIDTAQNTFPYKVNYYISGTTTKVPGITPNPVTGTGYIGESVAITAPGVTAIRS